MKHWIRYRINMQDSHQDITTQTYNLWAQEYKKSTQDFIFPANMFEIFVWEISGKKVLDVGCAYGRDVLRLRNLWYESYWIDISQNLIEISDPHIREYLRVWDMTELKQYYQQSSFDAIMSSASILHVDKNVAYTVLEDIYSILQDNWVFFLTLKISDSEKTVFKNSISLPWVKKKYVYYSQEEIISILEEIWFHICKTHILETKHDDWLSIICKK